MASDQKIVAALHRPFTLGMLYDARKDQLVPGLPMWDSETLQKSTKTRSQRSSEFHVTASDSTEQKSSLLNVEASLKLSFLSGLVEVEGSAKYLNDRKQFKNQSRVVLQYKATTHFEQLLLTSDLCENIQNREMIEKGLATHVVTGIEYGANAFFVFDSQKLEASQVQDIQGKMETAIKIIPGFGAEGKVESHLNDEQKALTDTFSCEFYGDFILQSNPATFVAAVQTYVDLPKLLGEKGENSVPVRVWMMPLQRFNPKAAQLVQEISAGFLQKAENTLEDLANFKMRCNDSLFSSIVGKLPPLQSQLSTFNKLCNLYISELQRQMAEKCPAIREGKEKESVLRSLFDKRDKFCQENLSKWLDYKENEINVIQSCVGILEGLPILSSQAEVDRFVLSNPNCHGFIFAAVGNSTPFLDELGQYLEALQQDKDPKQPDIQAEGPRYNAYNAWSTIRKWVWDFKNESGSKFIAAFQMNPMSTIFVNTYKDGENVYNLSM